MQAEIFESSKAPLGKVLQLFAEVLVVGILIGGLAALVGRFIYLIILFPILMGLGAGLTIDAGVVKGKIRSRFVVVAAGLFATLIIYGSMHFCEYLWFRSDAAKAIQKQVVAKEGKAAADEDVQAYIDYVLAQETGAPGLIGFILLEAKQGVSISRVESSSDTGINLGAFTWLYWLIEMGLIGYGAISPGYKSTKQLFCEHCNNWVPGKLSENIGGVKVDELNQAAAHIKSGDYTSLGGMLKHGLPFPSIEFYTLTCQTCTTFPFYLTGQVISQTKKGQVQSKVIFAQQLNSAQRFALTSTINAPVRTPEHVRTEL